MQKQVKEKTVVCGYCLFWFCGESFYLFSLIISRAFLAGKRWLLLRLLYHFYLFIQYQLPYPLSFSNTLLNTFHHGQDKLDRLNLIFLWTRMDLLTCPYKEAICYQSYSLFFPHPLPRKAAHSLCWPSNCWRGRSFIKSSCQSLISTPYHFLKTLYYKDFYDYK